MPFGFSNSFLMRSSTQGCMPRSSRAKLIVFGSKSRITIFSPSGPGSVDTRTSSSLPDARMVKRPSSDRKIFKGQADRFWVQKPHHDILTVGTGKRGYAHLQFVAGRAYGKAPVLSALFDVEQDPGYEFDAGKNEFIRRGWQERDIVEDPVKTIAETDRLRLGLYMNIRRVELKSAADDELQDLGNAFVDDGINERSDGFGGGDEVAVVFQARLRYGYFSGYDTKVFRERFIQLPCFFQTVLRYQKKLVRIVAVLFQFFQYRQGLGFLRVFNCNLKIFADFLYDRKSRAPRPFFRSEEH